MRIKAPGFRLGAASAVAFSTSGQFVGQVGRRVAVYSVPQRRISVRSDWHYPHPAAIAFDTEDQWFAVRSTTGALAVASIQDGHPMDLLPPPGDVADDSPLLPGPDNHLIEACSSGTLRVRRVEGLQVEYVEQHPDFMLGALARSGHLFALAINRRQLYAPVQPPCRIELRQWPFSTSQRVVISDEFGFVHALVFAGGTERLALLQRRPADTARTISIVSSGDGHLFRESSSSEWRESRGFTGSPDGRYIVVGTRTGHALLDGDLEVIGHLRGEYPSDAQFSPDGKLLALGYWSHGLVLATGDIRSWFTDSQFTLQ